VAALDHQGGSSFLAEAEMCGLNAFQEDLASPITILGIFLQASQKHPQLHSSGKDAGNRYVAFWAACGDEVSFLPGSRNRS
jgi:hypothetical protein